MIHAVDRAAYVAKCRARWSGPALRDAVANWRRWQEMELYLVQALRSFHRDPLQRHLSGKVLCDGTLTDFLWKLQDAIQLDKRCLDPFLDFEETFQKVFLRRGLVIWCGLYLDSLRAAAAGGADLPLFAESPAVAPGEVAEAIAIAIDELSRLATVLTELADEEDDYWTEDEIASIRSEADLMAKSAKALQSLLPRPDSEASFSELRGRRNDQAHPPA